MATTFKQWAKSNPLSAPTQEMLDLWAKPGANAPTNFRNLFFRGDPYNATLPQNIAPMEGYEWQRKGQVDYSSSDPRYLYGFYQTRIPSSNQPESNTNQSGGLLNQGGGAPANNQQPAGGQVDTTPGPIPYGGLDFSALLPKYNPPATPRTQTQRVTPQYTDPRTTVAEQMAGLLTQDSPYMQAAAQRARQMMNARGLLNSTSGVDEELRAAIESALPIAQSDAQLYQDVQGMNQQYANTAGLQELQHLNTMEMQSRDAAINERMSYINTFNQERLGRADTANKEKLAYIDMDIRKTLAGTEQEYALELENLKQSYEITKNADTSMGTMYSDAMKSIATFLQNPELSPEQSSAGVKVIVDNLSAGLEFLAGITGTPNVGEPYALGSSQQTEPKQATPVTNNSPIGLEIGSNQQPNSA